MANCIVVIPVHQSKPRAIELAAFRNTLSVLRSHPIVLLTHSRLDISHYEKTSEEVGKPFEVEYFEEKYFTSVQSYNDLCFSPFFYKRFAEYEFMLICQLDVWLFRDELDLWCEKGYDYIGAPIYHAYNKKHFSQKFLGIGNGGFSLRSISHCLKITETNRNVPFVKPSEILWFYYNLGKYTEDFTLHFFRRLLIIPTVILKCFGIHNTLNFYIDNHVNEDLIFGTWSNKSWVTTAKLPDEQEASLFSFEVNPSYLFKLNGGQLPFGCHAFEKWEFEEFWRKYIILENVE